MATHGTTGADRNSERWTDRQSRRLTEFLVSAMAELEVPALSVAVVQGREVVYGESFGLAQLGGSARVTTGTRFLIGSATKPFTTLLIARLVEQGRVHWSTRIIELLPEFRLADPELTRTLDLRRCVSATVEMPRRELAFLTQRVGLRPEERLKEMGSMQPGTGVRGGSFQYSNYLVAAAGYAAARAYRPHGCLGDAFAAAMQDLVLGPLAMSSTCVRQETALAADAALPHAVDIDGRSKPIPVGLEQFCDSLQPAGGIWSTAFDLSRYLLLEINRGCRADGERIVSESLLLERRAPGVTINETSSYGLGLLLSVEEGRPVVRHPGNSLGFTTELCFLPEQRLGVAFLSNLGMAVHLTTAVRQRVVELACFNDGGAADSTLQTAVRKRAWVAKMNACIETDSASADWMQTLPGTYRSREFGAARIAKRGSGYRIEFDAWGSELAGSTRHDGARMLHLTDPPWFGGPFVISASGALVLASNNIACTFEKLWDETHQWS